MTKQVLRPGFGGPQEGSGAPAKEDAKRENFVLSGDVRDKLTRLVDAEKARTGKFVSRADVIEQLVREAPEP